MYDSKPTGKQTPDPEISFRIRQHCQSYFCGLIFSYSRSFKVHNYKLFSTYACISITNDCYKSNFEQDFAQMPKNQSLLSTVRQNWKVELGSETIFLDLKRVWLQKRKTLYLARSGGFFMTVSSTRRFTMVHRLNH